MVKRRNRKNQNQKQSKDTNDLKGKTVTHNNGKKNKSHAQRDTLSAHAKNMQPSVENKGPAKDKKEAKPGTVTKNKRQRKAVDSSNWPTKQDLTRMGEIFKNPNGLSSKGKDRDNHQEKNKPVIYGLGHGAKSTVKMKAISGNRYVLLHEESEEETKFGTSSAKNGGLSSQEEADKDMVLETQLISDPMTK